MTKSTPSCLLFLVAALAAVSAPLHGATKKAPVTRIESGSSARKPPAKPARPTPSLAPPAVGVLPAAPALPTATPRPNLDDLEKILADSATAGLPLAARGAIVIDALTGAPLYEKNADEPQFPASTTKILTALLVIEAGDLDREVECTLEDSKVGESSLELKPGQRYTRRQMLYGLMLKSANDVAHALGRDNAGTAAAFAEKMTRRAAELGAKTANFANANGLHDLVHFCSPRDLALISRAAMQQPLFRQIVSTRSYDWVRADGTVRPLANHNRMLQSFPGCTGVKTGYTNPAQQVLVSAALREGREVISVVMHTDKPGIWYDSVMLLSYGFRHPPGVVATAAPKSGVP
ncbi:MAG: D-alanyl-D-alanine carboxypeptidase [Chthoniobacter sp.]|nr:D-alanyl-D-alanine carboxypeptidase [Chthoniobacter sp.]